MNEGYCSLARMIISIGHNQLSHRAHNSKSAIVVSMVLLIAGRKPCNNHQLIGFN